MTYSAVLNQVARAENDELVLEKSNVTIAQWVREMQDDVVRATLISVNVKDGERERTIPLFSAPLNSIDVKFVKGNAVLKNSTTESQIMSAICRGSPHLVFSQDGIYMKVPKKEDQASDKKFSELKKYFQQSVSLYTAQNTQFGADELVRAYQKSDYKKSIENVTVNHPSHRTISLVGVDSDAYQFEYADEKIILNIWDEKFEVDAITHANGITLFVDAGNTEAYCPNALLSFQRASEKPARKKDEELLLQGIIDGDVESFAAYINKKRRLFMKSLMGKGVPEEKAEDILQDIQLRYLELVADHKWKFEGTTDKAAVWVEKVIRNRRMDILNGITREKKNLQTDVMIDGDGEEASIIDFLPAQDSDPAQLIEKYDFIAYMRELELRVTENPQSPLRHVVGYAYASMIEDGLRQHQYAADQQAPVESIKTFMLRGRRSLLETNMSPTALKNGTFSSTISSFGCLREIG